MKKNINILYTMTSFKTRAIAAELDEIIIPCQITNKTLCSCLDPCLVRLLVEFAQRLNQIKNSTTCPSSTQGPQSSQSTGAFFGPTIIKWQTKYQINNGHRLVLSQNEMLALYNYMTTKHSKFGTIMREVLSRQNRIYLARNQVYNPTSTQGPTISQGGAFSCVKINKHRGLKRCGKQPVCEGENKHCHGCVNERYESECVLDGRPDC